MKKFFYYAATVMLSVSLFTACSDDDDDGDDGGSKGTQAPTNVKVTNLGSQNAPASWGNEVEITGEGFATNAKFYLVPVASARAEEAKSVVNIEGAIALTLSGSTTNSLKFTVPFIYNGGTYDIYQVMADSEYKVATVYITEEKYVTSIKANNYLFAFTYDNGKLKTLRKVPTDNTELYDLYTYEFNSEGKLTGVSLENRFLEFTSQEYKIVTKQWMDITYNGNDVNIQYDGDQVKSIVLNLNEKGNVTKRSDSWESMQYDWDTGEEKLVTLTSETTFQYDSENNIAYFFEDDEKSLDVKITMDGKKTLFPKSALPSWYWTIQFTDNPFNFPIGYTQNVQSYITTQEGGFIMPGQDPTETISYEYSYDKDNYPIKVKYEDSESPYEEGVILTGAVIFEEISYKTK